MYYASAFGYFFIDSDYKIHQIKDITKCTDLKESEIKLFQEVHESALQRRAENPEEYDKENPPYLMSFAMRAIKESLETLPKPDNKMNDVE